MLILICLAILSLLLANERWARRYGLHSELSRKLIHVAVGSFVAFWPFLISWQQIRLLSLAFLLVVGVSKHFKLFRALHSVTRPTWGELYFALAVGLTTYLSHDKWIYAVSLLQMSLADGLAAVVGVRYGKGNDYRLWGQRKSLAGSAAFLSVSYILLLGYGLFVQPLGWPLCLGIAAAATVLENFALRGLDNLAVPLFVAAMLRLVG